MRPLSVPDRHVVDSGAEDLQVWALDLDIEAALAAEDWHVLSAEERHKALRFKFHVDRVRAVATRAALRRLLAMQLDCHPADVGITQTPGGKPMLAGHRDIDFNVSHSGCHALIAICRRGVVGIDIERRTDSVDVMNLAPLVLTSMERNEPAEQALDFFDRWVVKESVLKALGLGITEYLQAVSVFPADGGRLQISVTPIDWPPFCVDVLQVSHGYAAAIATTERSYARRSLH